MGRRIRQIEKERIVFGRLPLHEVERSIRQLSIDEPAIVQVIRLKLFGRFSPL